MSAVQAHPDPEARLGHRFRDRGLLGRALTPPSSGHPAHNQRLEFLGDALLNAAVAALLHREKPDWAEGDLSKLRGMLVRRESLQDWAQDLGLALRTGPRSPKAPSAASQAKALADAVEAVLGAMFLDVQAGGGDPFGAVQTAVERRFLHAVLAAGPGAWEVQDAKTTLQERAAGRGWAPPAYLRLGRSGPDHAPRFRVRVEAGGLSAEAEAGTLKAAETEAARNLLARIPADASGPLSSSEKLG